MVEKSSLEIYEVEEGFSRFRPLPTAKELREFYIDKYYQNGHGNYKDEYDTKKFNKILYKLHKKIIILRKLFFPKPENFLDIGCGQGYALKTFSENGWDVTGIDFTSQACEIHHPDMVDKIIEGDIYDVLETVGQYQVVHADNVLEHVLDPQRLLELCRDALTPDGVLIVDVPNEDSRFQRWLLQKGYIRKMFEDKYPDHLSFFNVTGLRNLCKKAGLVDMFIGDFSTTHLNINGVSVSLEEYLCTLPIQDALSYYCINGVIGLGPELMGFFKADK